MVNTQDWEGTAGKTEAPREEQTKRQERANRILDAAADLLLRWGNKKTTIDDIAKQAGVAKGTIYLHWKTRDDLFLALFSRERLREGERYVEQLKHNPEMATLHGLARYSIIAMQRNPLLKAMMLQDPDILGGLLHSANFGPIDIQERIQVSEKFILHLRHHGLIRSDMEVKEQLHMFSSILMGFVLIDRYLPEVYMVSDEERAEQAAETVRRTFELRPPSNDELLETTNQFDTAVKTIREIQKRESGL